MTDLVPCPFCGVKMHLDYDPVTGYFGPEAKHKNGCMIGTISFIDFADEHHAVHEWNTRALEALPAQEPVAFMYEKPGQVTRFHPVKWSYEGWTETPLYAAPVTQPQIDEHKTAKRLAKIMGGSFVPHKQPVQVEVGDRDEPGAIGDSVRKNREQSTIDFVQDWMMSGDHEPDQWHKDFAAAIDARAAVSPTKSSESALLEEALEALKPFAHAAFEADGWPDNEAFTVVLRPDDFEGLADGDEKESLITARQLRAARDVATKAQERMKL